MNLLCIQKLIMIETAVDPNIVVPDHDPYDKVYKNLPSEHHILRKVSGCEYCGA